MKADFFITYHHNDELAARWIAAVLKEVPFSILMESWDFLPGKNPIEKIEYMTAAGRCALVLLSERFLQEIGDAVSRQTVMETFSGVGTKAVILLRIDSCDVERVLGVVTYTNLFDMKEAEARKRLLTAVGTPTAYKKEPVPLQLTAMTREEVLEKRKAELEELLNTTIKHQYHMKLDLEQEKEKEVEVRDEETGKIIEKQKQWVWETVELETVLTDKNNYILVNPSGMGKTTFLNYAAYVLLDRDGDYPFVPLFTTCIALNNREGSIANFIQQRVDSFYNNSQTAIAQGEWDNLCVLLDALDQARDVDDIVASLQIHDKYHYFKKAKILLSSRQNTADKVKAGFKKIRLKLPEDDEVKHYLGEENYKKLEGHIAASRELVTVPVLLEMLKTITEKGYKASKLWNRADLYTEFTRILIDQERSKPRFWQDPLYIRHFIENELEQALERIAFFSLADNGILKIEKEKLVQYCETSEKKEALLNIGIILELFEDREQKIVFRHQSFQAYFAARYMYLRRPELFEKLTGDIGFFYNDVWYEVMRFFVGLEKDQQKIGNTIESILMKDKDIGTNILKKITRQCKRLFKIYDLTQVLRLTFAVCLVSEARASNGIVQNLHEQLRAVLTNEKQYRDVVCLNINKFNRSNNKQRTALFITLVRLLGSEKDVRFYAAKALGQICTNKDIPLLTPLLREENYWVRFFVAEIFGKICSAQDIQYLTPLLKDVDNIVRRAAVEAIGKIGSAQDINHLTPLLRDEYVQDAVAEALVKLVRTNDIPFLENLFKAKEWTVRKAAAEAFGKIGTPNDTSLLESLLREDDFFVCCAAADAVGNIGTRKDIHLLEPLLISKDINIRYYAVKALGSIVTGENIALIEPLLNDKDDWVRSAVVEVFGKIGSEKYISLLKSLLSDRSSDVRSAAAEALGKVGTAKDISLLNPLIKDESWSVRRAAANALGNIGTAFDSPLLGPMLRDKEKEVRNSAAEALGNIGTIECIPLLSSLIRSGWYCDAVSEAIEQIYKRSTPELRIDDVLPKSAKKEALFVKSAATQPLHILHISDIHYALEKDPTITCIFHEFLRDIQKWRAQQNNEKIHSICLTGDIAQSGHKNQYESINEKINAILNTTGCSKDHLFIIPGNHDVREYHKISDKSKTTLKEVRENKMNIDTGVLSNFENYREFHEKFNHYYEFLETSGYLNSLPLSEKRSGSPKPWYSGKLQDFPVRIIGLNSALFCLKEFNEYGKIRMGTNQFHEAYFQGKPGNIPKDELVILLTHHPVNWLSENEYEDYTTLMERYGIIHLHGHIHRTKIRKLFSIAGSSYISVGTGSLYGEKGLGDINTYHIITLDFKKEEVHIWARRWIPERGCWGVYDNDINNTFPFPGKHH